MHCNMIGETLTLSLRVFLIVERKKQDRLAAASPKSDETLDQAAAIKAAFFCLLPLTSRPHRSQASAEKRCRHGQRRLGNYDIIFKLDKVIIHRAPIPRSDPAHGDFPSCARGR
jgi:hypothetical protein